MRKGCWVILVLLICGLAGFAAAEEARDITGQCDITGDGKASEHYKLTDEIYTTRMPFHKGWKFEVDARGQAVSGVVVKLWEHTGDFALEAYRDETWEEVCTGGSHLSDWFPMPEGTTRVRIVNTGTGRLYISELVVYGEGDRPREAPSWRDLDKCDLLLVSAHPDDELLWFGGLLPTYAGERGYDVQVLCLVPTGGRRRLELLDALWHCGVTAYPAFGGLRDVRETTLQAQYKVWGRDTVDKRVTEVIRQYQPEVLVTHDLNGEYGHGAHQVAADASVRCADLAANARKYPASAKKWGVWQVKKVYVHEYRECQVHLDWTVPLAAFDGKDGLTVAEEALAYHVSQVQSGWSMAKAAKHDNSVFGLYATEVGEDAARNDLFEHILLPKEVVVMDENDGEED